MQTTHLSAQGFDTDVLLAGDERREPILLLHDAIPGSCAATDWATLVARLAADHRVLAPDLLGFGATASDFQTRPGVSSWTRMRVAQVLAVLDELAVYRTHLVAAGLSAPVALALVSQDPDRFTGVCLVGAAGGRAEVTPELRSCLSFYDDPCVEAMTNLVAWSHHDPDRGSPPLADVVRDRYAEAVRTPAQQAFVACYSSSRVAEQLLVAPSVLRRIEHPVLLVHGREDRLVRPASSLHLHELLPNAAVHLLPNTGHAIASERLDDLDSLLHTYLHALA